jgi:hypothetical protein
MGRGDVPVSGPTPWPTDLMGYLPVAPLLLSSVILVGAALSALFDE